MRYKTTLAILSTCFIVQVIGTRHPEFLDFMALYPASGPLWPLGLVTAAFAHISWDHFLGNFSRCAPMMAYLEYRLGSRRTLWHYLACGVAGGAAYELVNGGWCIGASGALFGAIASAHWLFGERWWEKAISRLLLAYMILIQYLVFLDPSTNIAASAHLGGAVMGILLAMYWKRRLPPCTLTPSPASLVTPSSSTSTPTSPVG